MAGKMKRGVVGRIKNLAVALRDSGWAGTLDEFKLLVIRVHLQKYPFWSHDTLRNYPRLASLWCDAVAEESRIYNYTPPRKPLPGVTSLDEAQHLFLAVRERIRKDGEEEKYGWNEAEVARRVAELGNDKSLFD